MAMCMHMCHIEPMATASRRLVVLLEERDYQGLHREAERSGRSMASIVREAVREKLASPSTADPAGRAAAIEVLCGEHDPGFDWSHVKRDLERRHG
jgi:hypothetical protein